MVVVHLWVRTEIHRYRINGLIVQAVKRNEANFLY